MYITTLLFISIKRMTKFKKWWAVLAWTRYKTFDIFYFKSLDIFIIDVCKCTYLSLCIDLRSF